MGIVSYAQNFEDVMLWRALNDVKNGFYIDIGANDHEEHSVTKSMYDLGWRGINCEPVRYWFIRLEKYRTRDINLQVAIGSNNTELEFFEVVNSGLSTLNKSVAEEHSKKLGFEIKSYLVPVKTLTTICEEENINQIHFLKIDVEGAEKFVLEGIDFKIIRPWIVLIEATKPMSQNVDYAEWESLILSEKYHFVYFDGLNRFYIADEHNELDCHFSKPPNIFDGFILSSQIKAEAKVSEAEAKASEAEAKASEAEARTNDALHHYHTVINSNSWKIMKPFRILGKLGRWFYYGIYHWITFSSTSRPRRIIKQALVSSKHYINSNPKLKYKVIQILNKFPSIKNRLKKIGSSHIINNKIEINELTERGNEVYKNLNSKFKRLNKEKF